MDSFEQRQPALHVNTSIINCINDAVIIFRKTLHYGDAIFTDANNAAIGLFGCTKEELLNLSFEQIFNGTTYNSFLKAKDLSRISEGACTRKDGTTFPVEFYINPVDEEENKFMLVITDISSKKANEQQLARYIEELHENKDLMERNAYELVLLNLKLEESEERLKELNASKDKFFSIIAHDLKSPFTSFLGLSELLAEDFDEMDSGEIKTLLMELNKNAQNVYSLLENLLSWSRVQTGRMDFAPELIAPFEIIEKTQNLFEPVALQKGILLTSSIYSSRNIFSDRNMAETILRNLVSNAIKFTPENGVISVTVSDLEDFVEFSVRDSGVGIESDNLAKLFRIDSTHTTLGTKNEKGTGLGLILCKELVERNGGTMTVNSKLGVGTKFSFTVPTKKPKE